MRDEDKIVNYTKAFLESAWEKYKLHDIVKNSDTESEERIKRIIFKLGFNTGIECYQSMAEMALKEKDSPK